jgi:hypothetical protein
MPWTPAFAGVTERENHFFALPLFFDIAMAAVYQDEAGLANHPIFAFALPPSAYHPTRENVSLSVLPNESGIPRPGPATAGKSA